MSKKGDSLGDRMKNYESISRNFLTRRVPAIIRLDGKAFHTFTRGMQKPFDSVLTQTMQETMKYLCENIQGCVLGYTQSDEITLVLTDYTTTKTDAWFGYNVQKMTSVSASMATLAFNRVYQLRAYSGKVGAALFDSRAFSVPRDEVCNCLIWRQQDATRNSIEAVGQANFSHRQLHGKSCDEVQDMLFTIKGINWNNLPTENKRGSCCVKKQFEEDIEDLRNPGHSVSVCRKRWVIDHEIPIFSQDRGYIEKLI